MTDLEKTLEKICDRLTNIEKEMERLGGRLEKCEDLLMTVKAKCRNLKTGREYCSKCDKFYCLCDFD